MPPLDSQPPKRLDRRGFLRSILGLGADGLPAFEAKLHQQFVWTDLRTGQMGFPLGLSKVDVLPGSLMHLVAAAGLVDESLLKPEFTHHCVAEKVGENQSFECTMPHGEVDLARALAVNCSSFFVSTARLISTPLLLRFSESFGLNQPVGTFSGGIFPKSRTGNSTSFVTGLNREMRPTLLQILRMNALIASNGRLPVKMHSAEQTVEGEEPVQTKLKSDTWKFLQGAMREACLMGVAKTLDPNDKMRISAAVSVVEGKSGFTQWVCGFFPFDQPIYAFTICCPSAAPDDTGIRLSRELLLAQEWF